MSEESDPLLTFFSASEAESLDILYVTLGCTKDASADDLRKAYRKAALRCHPDKHASKSEEERAVLHVEFQKIGFAWAVLSDEKRRKRYDATGRTDELKFDEAGEAGWDAYFEDLFERFDRKALDEDKAKYQGSEEELVDLRAAFVQTKGSWPGILERIPHSTHEDETRLIALVEAEITAGTIESTRKWTTSSTDSSAAKKRKRAAEKDAAAAEEAAKELGVWDEFYGSGKKGRRAADDKENKKSGKTGDGEDALAALILRRQQQRSGGLDALEAKYRKIEETRASKKSAGGKKGKKATATTEEPVDAPHPGDLDDDAFAALQAKMFGNKASSKKSKAEEAHPDDLDDDAFAALQAKMFANKANKASGSSEKAAKKRKTKA